MTINEGLTLIKAIRKRIANLESLRDEVSTETHYMTATESIRKPQYDVKAVDKKITELEEILFNLDNAIKRENATTEIDIQIDTGVIFASLA